MKLWNRKRMAGQFRFAVWDPILIVSQILTMQSIYYTCLGLWVALMEVLLGTNPSLDHMFNYQVSMS